MQSVLILILILLSIAWISMVATLFEVQNDTNYVPLMVISTFCVIIAVSITAITIPQGSSKSYIDGTPDNGYIIYYNDKPVTEEERKAIKQIHYIENDFNVEIDKRNKKILITNFSEDGDEND